MGVHMEAATFTDTHGGKPVSEELLAAEHAHAPEAGVISLPLLLLQKAPLEAERAPQATSVRAQGLTNSLVCTGELA